MTTCPKHRTDTVCSVCLLLRNHKVLASHCRAWAVCFALVYSIWCSDQCWTLGNELTLSYFYVFVGKMFIRLWRSNVIALTISCLKMGHFCLELWEEKKIVQCLTCVRYKGCKIYWKENIYESKRSSFCLGRFSPIACTSTQQKAWRCIFLVTVPFDIHIIPWLGISYPANIVWTLVLSRNSPKIINNALFA